MQLLLFLLFFFHFLSAEITDDPWEGMEFKNLKAIAKFDKNKFALKALANRAFRLKLVNLIYKRIKDDPLEVIFPIHGKESNAVQENEMESASTVTTTTVTPIEFIPINSQEQWINNWAQQQQGSTFPRYYPSDFESPVYPYDYWPPLMLFPSLQLPNINIGRR